MSSSASNSSVQRFTCGAQCGQPDNDFGMVQCDDCDTWYHFLPIDCTNGTLDPKKNNRNKHWICQKKCKIYFVKDIVEHEYVARYGHMKYNVLWQDDSMSWVWEEDMTGCPKLLRDYARKHNITVKHIDPSERDYRKLVGHRRPLTRSATAAGE